MIGIDTNILLRLWLDDDPAQTQRIDLLLAEHGAKPESLLVTDVVLVEAIWTLKSAFGQGKSEQLKAVTSLLNETAFAFEHRETVERAVALFTESSCGFSDCLIVATHALRHCLFTASFDRGMQKLAGVRAP